LAKKKEFFIPTLLELSHIAPEVFARNCFKHKQPPKF